jgi:hypothetical protein
VAPKFAVTFRAAFISTEQVVCVPAQSPDHPRNRDPGEEAALSWTGVPLGYEAVQVPEAQLMPEAVTVPVPVPPTVTASE